MVVVWDFEGDVLEERLQFVDRQDNIRLDFFASVPSSPEPVTFCSSPQKERKRTNQKKGRQRARAGEEGGEGCRPTSNPTTSSSSPRPKEGLAQSHLLESCRRGSLFYRSQPSVDDSDDKKTKVSHVSHRLAWVEGKLRAHPPSPFRSRLFDAVGSQPPSRSS